MKKLAEQLFELQNLEEKLWMEVGKIMGYDMEGEIPYYDCWVDSYDSSIEVVLSRTAAPMNKEQIFKILDLGFDSVYVSHGEEGIKWTKTDNKRVDARNLNYDTPHYFLAMKYKNELDRLREEIEDVNLERKVYDL
jgi:hypothetical protein